MVTARRARSRVEGGSDGPARALPNLRHGTGKRSARSGVSGGRKSLLRRLLEGKRPRDVRTICERQGVPPPVYASSMRWRNPVFYALIPAAVVAALQALAKLPSSPSEALLSLALLFGGVTASWLSINELAEPRLEVVVKALRQVPGLEKWALVNPYAVARTRDGQYVLISSSLLARLFCVVFSPLSETIRRGDLLVSLRGRRKRPVAVWLRDTEPSSFPLARVELRLTRFVIPSPDYPGHVVVGEGYVAVASPSSRLGFGDSETEERLEVAVSLCLKAVRRELAPPRRARPGYLRLVPRWRVTRRGKEKRAERPRQRTVKRPHPLLSRLRSLFSRRRRASRVLASTG